MPASNQEPIEASYVESPPDPTPEPSRPGVQTSAPGDSVDPLPCPGPTPATRTDVLRCARTLAAQVTGLAGLVEQAALTPNRVRPIFLTAWRTWCGAFLADAGRLERSIFIAQEEAAKLAGYAGRLAEWRGGIAGEVGQGASGHVTSSSSEPQPVAGANPPKKSWPWFVWMPVGFGSVVGAYMSVRWVFRQCMESVVTSGNREQAGEQKST